MHTQNVFPFKGYCDIILESCKEGIRKPDTRIYQIACNKLGVKPSEVMHTHTHSHIHYSVSLMVSILYRLCFWMIWELISNQLNHLV